MRQHVRQYVLEALTALGLAGRACAFLEVGSYEVEGSAGPGEGGDGLRQAVLGLCPGSSYVGLDRQAGPGVDLVDDVETPGTPQFDGLWGRSEVVLCVDTLEHVKRPWLALRTIADLLRPGGVMLCAVPFAFPIHARPDYYRFTPEGVQALLAQYFAEVVVQQDPVSTPMDQDGLLPHTVTAVAKKGRAFTDEQKQALLGLHAWQTGAQVVTLLPQGHTLMLGVSSPEAVPVVRRAVMAVLGQEALEARYQRLCAEPSDIHEHLPTLRRLAREARSLARGVPAGGYAAEGATVVELGVRHAVSSTALLAGLSEQAGDVRKRMVMIDCDARAVGLAVAALGPLTGAPARVGGLDLQGWVGDSCEYDLLNTHVDLLFVDTLHTYEQLGRELRYWRPLMARNSRIALHDTTTFGETGEDGATPGLQQAVAEFLEEHKDWAVEEEYTNNNGLMVLRRTT